MPLLDRRSDAVVLRVVYDGPPEAGKTTNLGQLSQRISLNRRGALESPETTGGRTLFFDWMDVEGGYVGGRRIRCQLVTVPGQPELLRRRRHLLRSADVVVFVADSQPEKLALNRRLVDELRALLTREGVGIVLQANKQDVPGALPPGVLRAELGLAEAVQIVPAQAQAGAGVLETFMLAVRLAVERVRALLVSGALEGTRPAEESPEALLAALRAEEPGALERIAAAATALVEEEPASAAAAAGRPLPRADVPAGLVWPPVDGRTVLQALERAGEPELREEGGGLYARVGPWRLVASARDRYADIDVGRRSFIAAVQVQRLLGDLLPKQRTLALAEDGAGWRLWTVTPGLSTLSEALDSALARGEIDSWLDGLLEGAARIAQLEAATPHRVRVAPEGFAWSEGRLRYVGEVTGDGAARTRDALALALLELVVVGCADAAALVAAARARGLPLEAHAAQPPAADEVVAVDAVEELPEPPCEAPPLPRIDVPAGLVWPPVRGRATLASLPQTPGAAAAKGARIEVRWPERFVLHTEARWRFHDLDAARAALMEEVRLQARLGPFLPPGRTIAVAGGEPEWWLWVITPLQPPPAPSLRAEALSALYAHAERHQLVVGEPDQLGALGDLVVYLGPVAEAGR